jgi:hypothetical protein
MSVGLVADDICLKDNIKNRKETRPSEQKSRAYIHIAHRPISTKSLILLSLFYLIFVKNSLPIPVAVLSKAWVCGRSLTRFEGWNPAGGMDICLL